MAWPVGDGGIAALMRAHDWAATPLGPVEDWPQSLKCAAQLVLDAPMASVLLWGSDHRIVACNERYRDLLEASGEMLGRCFLDVWAEARTILAPQLARVWAGETLTFDDVPIALDRGAGPRTYWFDCGYGLVRDEAGSVAGIVASAREREARLASEALFRQFNEFSSDVIWIRDAETMQFDYVSPAIEAVYGVAPAAFKARHNDLKAWAEIIHPDDRAGALEAFREVRTGKRVTHEFRILRPDDAERWVRDTTFPLLNAAGQVERIAGIGKDVTHEKRAEQMLREREEQQSFLLSLSDAIRPLDDDEAIMAATARLLGEHLGVARVGYGEVDAAAADLDVRVEWRGGGERSAVGRQPLSAYGAELIAHYRSGEAWIVDDVESDPRPVVRDAREGYLAWSVRAAVSIPLIKRGEWVASLYVNNGQPRLWSVSEVRLIREVAERTWAAVESARTEAALGISEARLQSLVEGMPQLVWRAAGDGQWTWASPQWTEFTGQSDQASHRRGWLDPVHPDDRGGALEIWSRAEAEGAFHTDYRLFHSGEQRYRWFQSRAAPVCDDRGNIVEWLGTSTDVDDLRSLQDRQRILVSELQHRVRNILAVIRSVFNRTADAGADIEDVVRHFQGRLDSLARTQVIVTRNAEGTADLEGLIRDELISVGPGNEETHRIDGPDVSLGFELAEMMGLAIHELTTNSLKYGALRFPKTTIDIRWVVNIDHNGTRRLDFTWIEKGVPMVSVLPAHGGFGRELIEEALPYRTGATTKLDFSGGGVRCAISLPLPTASDAHALA